MTTLYASMVAREAAVGHKKAGAIADDEGSEHCYMSNLERDRIPSLVYMSGAFYRD